MASLHHMNLSPNRSALQIRLWLLKTAAVSFDCCSTRKALPLTLDRGAGLSKGMKGYEHINLSFLAEIAVLSLS